MFIEDEPLAEEEERLVEESAFIKFSRHIARGQDLDPKEALHYYFVKKDAVSSEVIHFTRLQLYSTSVENINGEYWTDALFDDSEGREITWTFRSFTQYLVRGNNVIFKASILEELTELFKR